jgi:hypothetical protein
MSAPIVPATLAQRALTWLRWACAHTLAGAGMACASALIELRPQHIVAALAGQLLLAVLFCLIYGLTLSLVVRQIPTARTTRVLIATLAIAPWLLAVPLSLGVPPQSEVIPRLLAATFAATGVGIAMQPELTLDGRNIWWIGASALAWAIIVLADGLFTSAIYLTLARGLLAAALSGALSGALGGLCGGWLAAVGWAGRDSGRSLTFGDQGYPRTSPETSADPAGRGSAL